MRSTPWSRLALVVVFRGTGTLNFAQGEMATLSAFIVWVLNDDGVPLLLATLLGMAFGFALGAATEVTIVRPLSKKSPLAVFVATIALFLGINAFTTGYWGAPPEERLDSLFPNDPDDFLRILGTTWRYVSIGALAVTLVLTLVLFVLFKRTRFGLAMRGVASNPESARLVGVPTGRVLAGSWGLAGALGALAATLVAGCRRSDHADDDVHGLRLRHRRRDARWAGQPRRRRDRLACSSASSRAEAAEFSKEWVGQDMKLAVALLCIFVVLLFKPSGLFGTSKVERV